MTKVGCGNTKTALDKAVSVESYMGEYHYFAKLCTTRNRRGRIIDVDWGKLEGLLQDEGGWTPDGAKAIVQAARDYGWFMLRHIMALAIALDIEDGDQGF